MEFAYNISMSQTMDHNPFEIVYRRNPLTPLELVPILPTTKMNTKAEARVEKIQKIDV